MATINLSNPIITPRIHASSVPPFSGTGGTFAGGTGAGALLVDQTNQVTYINEGTKASPYWTPVNFEHPGLLAFHSDFRSQIGKAVANGDNTAIIPDSGLRVHGQGIEEADSGLTVANAEDGNIATLTATNQASHLAALGTDAGVFQPDQHTSIVVDAEFAVGADLDTKTVAMGFIGTATDLLDPPVTSTTVTMTLVQDDLALMLMDAALTDAAGIMLPWNKSNGAATIVTTETTGGTVDTATDVEAAGTYQRWRVELQRTTTVVKAVYFKDKAQIGTITDALDEDEECSPVLYIGSGTTSTEALLIKRFSAWGTRA